MIDLEAALFDLAEHLDHPIGEHLGETVRRRVAPPAPTPDHRRRRARALLAIAAAIVVTVSVVALTPARHAIADWLGIGAVEVRHSDAPVPTGTGSNTVPGAPGSGSVAPNHEAMSQLGAARKKVSFAIATPGTEAAGLLTGVEVDTRPRGGLVVLRYARFTLVEIASDTSNGPVLGKLLGPEVRVDNVTVAGVQGLWITGAHEIGYLDRSGSFETDTVRRSGPVLMWARAGVTYRIEGLTRIADAQAIGRSIH